MMGRTPEGAGSKAAATAAWEAADLCRRLRVADAEVFGKLKTVAVCLDRNQKVTGFINDLNQVLPVIGQVQQGEESLFTR
ncbi:MAG: hypothetical protein ACRD1R_16000 [Acidobacteriota bacterium]